VHRWAARQVLGRCDALFTHAELLAGGLRRLDPDRPIAWHAIPPSPVGELPDREPARGGLGIGPERRVALFLGLIRPYKGVSELGLADRVRLELRWIPEPELPTLLAAADVVVLPYRAGSQSAVAPLALGAGVPVVASGVGGVPEVVEHEENGLIVDPGSVASLVAAFRSLDDVRLARLAEGARRWSRSVTWDSYAEALERLIERVI
jgi:glycosyltransferase involved in cell wall biosynthesis